MTRQPKPILNASSDCVAGAVTLNTVLDALAAHAIATPAVTVLVIAGGVAAPATVAAIPVPTVTEAALAGLAMWAIATTVALHVLLELMPGLVATASRAPLVSTNPTRLAQAATAVLLVNTSPTRAGLVNTSPTRAEHRATAVHLASIRTASVSAAARQCHLGTMCQTTTFTDVLPVTDVFLVLDTRALLASTNPRPVALTATAVHLHHISHPMPSAVVGLALLDITPTLAALLSTAAQLDHAAHLASDLHALLEHTNLTQGDGSATHASEGLTAAQDKRTALCVLQANTRTSMARVHARAVLHLSTRIRLASFPASHAAPGTTALQAVTRSTDARLDTHALARAA